MTVDDWGKLISSCDHAIPATSRVPKSNAGQGANRCMPVYIARRAATCQNAFPPSGVKKGYSPQHRKKVPEMSRIFPVLAAATALAACTTYKMWAESAADQDTGIVQLSYEFRKFENPQVDERAAISMARERCRGWGYKDAHRQSEDRQCTQGLETDCSKWKVLREYQCLGAPK
jgi:hypothetical protein